MFKEKTKKETILIGTFIVMLMNNIFIYEVFAGLLDIDLIAEMTMTYQEISNFIPQLSQNISLDVFLSFIPIVLIIMSVMEMYIVILLCQLCLTRLKVEFPGNFHIATMHISEKSGFITALIMFLTYILKNYMGIESIYLTYAYTLCMFIFGLQGLSFSCFYLIVKQKTKFMIFAFLMVFIPFGSTIYIVLGILDIFSDLRRNLLYNENNEG